MNAKELLSDIQAIKLAGDTTIDQLLDSFYDVCRKHGIKKGTLTEGGGVATNTAEWTIACTLFVDHVASHLQMHDFFAEVPADIYY